MPNLWQKQTVFDAVMSLNTSRLWKIIWISFILIIIIEVILLIHTSHHLKLNASWQVELLGNILNSTIQTESYHSQISDNTSEFIEEKDMIMDLFEDIEISVLCDIFHDVNASNKINPPNITLSEETLYARVRLRIEQGECTNQTVFTKWVNYSIGLGVNKLRYTIVPEDYKWLNITGVCAAVEHMNYTSYNHVYSVRFNVARFLSQYHGDKQLLKVCILEQNCLHWIDRSRHCGLQDISDVIHPEFHSLTSNWNRSGGWIAFLEYINNLCDQNLQGHGLMSKNVPLVTHSAWFVPCIRCNSHPDEEANCDWSSALWFEANNPIYPCIYSEKRTHNDQKQLSAYLKNKVLLFFGDSTLRGLMYSLVYRLNKTKLFNVQETHGEMMLINNGAKLIRFIYYPDYSKKEHQSNRSLITDLIQSLFRFKRKFNEALLFFGGVRWLNSFHMKQLQIIINKQKVFQSVRVFIKDYSAGFHTPVDGLPFVDWVRKQNARWNMKEITG
ncbi:unnamed protein product [Trichobilharzia szidati]|nr:unnamed protein product [Trichobilharzia szidati]